MSIHLHTIVFYKIKFEVFVYTIDKQVKTIYNKKSQNTKYATMAQEVEHVLGKDGVTGSNPVSSSTMRTSFGKSFLSFATNWRMK